MVPCFIIQIVAACVRSDKLIRVGLMQTVLNGLEIQGLFPAR